MTDPLTPTDQHARIVAQGTTSLRLVIALLLALTVLTLEVVGGLVTGSLALLSDATHVLVDVVALAIGIGAARLAARAPDARHTYGFHRWEVIGALANGVLLVAASAVVFVEAIGRLRDPAEVDASLVLVVATIGLVVNATSAWIVHGSERSTSATRVLVLHLGGDALGALAVIASAIFIMAGGSTIADPVASLFIATLLAVAGVRLLGQIVHVLMEGIGPGVAFEEVASNLRATPGVAAVHDLHVWALVEDMPIVSAHLEVKSGADRDTVLSRATGALAESGFDHSTLQVEPGPCGQGRPASSAAKEGQPPT